MAEVLFCLCGVDGCSSGIRAIAYDAALVLAVLTIADDCIVEVAGVDSASRGRLLDMVKSSQGALSMVKFSKSEKSVLRLLVADDPAIVCS